MKASLLLITVVASKVRVQKVRKRLCSKETLLERLIKVCSVSWSNSNGVVYRMLLFHSVLYVKENIW